MANLYWHLPNKINRFRLADLQIGRLIPLNPPRPFFWEDIQDRLNSLPCSLMDIYDEIYAERIDQNLKVSAKIAKRAIMWVLAAKEPLTSEELLFAVRINPMSSNLGSTGRDLVQLSTCVDSKQKVDEDLEDEVVEDMLLEFCANFLMLQQSTRFNRSV